MSSLANKIKISREYNFEFYLSYGLKGLLVVMAIFTFFRGEFTWFIGTLFSIYITSLPTIMKRDYDVTLPLIFDLAITASISLHVIGGYVDFYTYIGGYDHVTHFISSATISLIAVTTLYIMNFHTKLISLPPLGFGLVAIFFTMSMGVVWEFLEWGTDIFLGTSLQHGLQDTMVDLLFDTLAGSIVGTIASIRLRKGEFFEHGSFLEIGDIENSVGYKHWKEIASKDRKIGENIAISLKDPNILENILNNIVEESKHISERQKEAWKKIMNDIKDDEDDNDPVDDHDSDDDCDHDQD